MRWIWLLFVGLILSACGAKEAQPFKKQSVVIASDYLTDKDTAFFSWFKKHNHIRVQILHLSADSISKKLKKEGFNTQIDLVMVHSMQAAKQLHKNAFERLPYVFRTEHFNHYLAFSNGKWLVSGIDPYVFSYYPDSLDVPVSYNELCTDYKWSKFKDDSLDMLYAHVKIRLKESKKYRFKDWKKGWKKHYVSFEKGTDSLPSKQLLVHTYSRFVKDPYFKKGRKKRSIIYPNQGEKGLYADRVCMSIVFRARHYDNAILVLEYLNQPETLRRFNEKHGFFSVMTSNGKPNPFFLCHVSENKLYYALP